MLPDLQTIIQKSKTIMATITLSLSKTIISKIPRPYDFSDMSEQEVALSPAPCAHLRAHPAT